MLLVSIYETSPCSLMRFFVVSSVHMNSIGTFQRWTNSLLHHITDLYLYQSSFVDS